MLIKVNSSILLLYHLSALRCGDKLHVYLVRVSVTSKNLREGFVSVDFYAPKKRYVVEMNIFILFILFNLIVFI